MNNACFNAILATCGLVCSSIAVASYQDVVLADNPVAYYRFEETSGTTANDTSGNGNIGTYMNGVELGRASAPQLGRAARFDGIDGFVETQRTVATDFTLEMWVSTNSTSPSGSAAYEGDGLLWSDVGGQANDFVMGFLNNGLSFFTGDSEVSVNSDVTINNGGWHHLVATRALGGAMRIYIDGALHGTGVAGNAPLVDNPLLIIGGNTLDGRYFEGLIDEVAYYPSVLSAARIRAHYEAGVFVAAVPTMAVEPLMAVAALLLLTGLAAARRNRVKVGSE